MEEAQLVERQILEYRHPIRTEISDRKECPPLSMDKTCLSLVESEKHRRAGQ